MESIQAILSLTRVAYSAAFTGEQPDASGKRRECNATSSFALPVLPFKIVTGPPSSPEQLWIWSALSCTCPGVEAVTCMEPVSGTDSGYVPPVPVMPQPYTCSRGVAVGETSST